jgi:homogentisate phytyltransferase/homogentisate geranylgeranyltransferase
MTLTAFGRFARPHTIVATTLQVSGLFLLAGGGQLAAGGRAFGLALAAALLANVYIVGLNQLTDVAIDRVNKPALPLASGALTVVQARGIVLIAGLSALALAAAGGPYLLLTVAAAMAVGTGYSLPPLRLKERAAWAALSIAFVRGLVVNVGLFLYFQRQLRPGAPLPWPLLGGLALFFFGFGLVIALYKDIPDLPGDRQFGVRTFTVRRGPAYVFDVGRWLLTGFYLLPIVLGLARLPAADGIVLLISHLILVAVFWTRSRAVDLAEPAAVTRFYMFLWGLFYAEYVLLGLNAVVGV